MKRCILCPNPTSKLKTCNTCRGVKSTWEKSVERKFGRLVGEIAGRLVVERIRT